MNSENIFIHIPKTGGTTINCVINKTEWQTTPDFNYRHILYETKKSNCADIFNPLNYDKYVDNNIFMLVRHPIDRIISEYYFIKDREEFIGLINPKPNSIKDYIKNKQTSNYMTGFLLGKRMYDTDVVDEDDLKLVLNTINNLNIKVGVFEEYHKSLLFFSKVTGIKLPKKIDVKRITLNRPSLHEVSEDLKQLIIKHNNLDIELYNYCVEKFKNDSSNIALEKANFTFNSNKYNYVLKYTQRFNLLEIAIKDKAFLKSQHAFFYELNQYLHHSLKLKSGEVYVKIWNDTFLKALKNVHGSTDLTNDFAIKEFEDELSRTIYFCNSLDLHLRRGMKSLITKPLIFDASFINKNLIPKKGIFSFFK